MKPIIIIALLVLIANLCQFVQPALNAKFMEIESSEYEKKELHERLKSEETNRALLREGKIDVTPSVNGR